MLLEEEKRELQEMENIISKLGEKERAMASGYISALRDVEMLQNEQKAAG